MPDAAGGRWRVRLFVLLVTACALVAIATVVATMRGGGTPRGAAESGGSSLATARAAGRPVLLLRDLDRSRPASFGRVALTGLPPGSRTLLPMRCERVHFAAGTGVCLTRGTGLASGYRASVFDADLRARGEVPVAGVPSRARVSPDGRYASVTLFVSGHSYADLVGFSTTTTLIDTVRGRRIADLEELEVTHDGERVTAVDRNFWGVTFARDGDRFYATLATGGRLFLVEGSIRARRMRTIHPEVECPSLSPDGRRVAFKKRVGAGGTRWRLHVLDLATLRETPLAEERSVDDQVEWLDDRRVLYGLREQVWTAAADGSGQPRPFARGGGSPAVLRW